MGQSIGAQRPRGFSLPAFAGPAVLAILGGWRCGTCCAMYHDGHQTCAKSISLSGGANDIFDTATLTVTNTGTGTISGSLFGINGPNPANITNYGTILGGITIAASPSVTVALNVTNNLGP